LTSRLLRGFALLAVVLFVALLAYGLLTKAPRTSINERLAESRPAAAPAFELELLAAGSRPAKLRRTLTRAAADGRLSLAELRGVPIVLNFWASWCPPCRTETPRLERAWRSAQKQGVLFLGLDMQDVSSDAREFLDENDVSYPNVRDKGNDVALRWGVTGLPETFFLRRDGRVIAHVVGEVSDEQLRRGVAGALSGRVVGASSGGERRSTR
jgi:cytochrome c biogenesis protein CcmG/thiol:disulfide interchange protein DsbE